MEDETLGVAGLVLAGGGSRRMGENKGLLKVGGERLLDRVWRSLEVGVDVMALNGERSVWEGEVDCMIVEDVLEGGEGPLVGILSGLLWAESEGKEWLVTVPLDTPFLPSDIVLRLVRGAQEGGAGVSCARSGRYHHPVVGCWHVGGWLGRVRGALERGVRKIDRVFEEGERVSVDVEMVFFGEGFCYDPLMNVNDREDLLKAEEIGMRLRGRERG